MGVEIQCGKLRHRVQILQEVSANVDPAQGGQDPTFHQPVLQYRPFLDRYAAIEPSSGRELWEGLHVEADISHKITIRYVPQLPTGKRLSPKMQVSYQGRIFNILWVRDVEERRRKMELFCIEQL